MLVYTLLAVLLLLAVHLFAYRLQLTHIPRSKWLSFAGGISVAYIFVQVLFELQEYQAHIAAGDWGGRLFEGRHAYLFALLGLTVFYGLERAAKRSSESDRTADASEDDNLQVFWIHILSFTVYNFIIGYLLLEQAEESLSQLILYTIAMALHLMVNDHGLQDHYPQIYRSRGRWLLVAGLATGWLAGVLTHIPTAFLGVIFSFIAGGVIMNVLKEELPKERESNFWAFGAGVLLFTALLLAI
jgi:zinc transporter ZupT